LKILTTPANTDRTWRFGVFEVDARREELRRSGAPIKIRDQSFRILVYLLEHPGEIVTREELRQVLWPSDTFVDFDHSLNTAVMKLREALGDSTGATLYIETIPKRGYRFIAPVSPAGETRNGLANAASFSPSPSLNENIPEHEPASASVETPPAGRRMGRAFMLVGSLVGLIVLAAAGWLMLQRTRRTAVATQDGMQDSTGFEIVPVTTAPGNAGDPVFSTDGREIAYIWDGADRKRSDVYVQILGADLPLRLTYSKSGVVGPPAWSPDGREIAFSRCDGKNDGVYVVPALGGDERQLTSVSCLHTQPGSLAWLSDGTRMLMIDHCTAAGLFGVVLYSIPTGEKRCIARSGFPEDSDFGYEFSLSPDGSTIAFSPSKVLQDSNIYIVPLVGGPPHQVTSEGHSKDPMWTPDGKSIVFVSDRSTLSSLWRVSASGGPIQRETTYPAIGSFSKDGRRFVYAEQGNTEAGAIWRANLASAGGPVLENKKLVSTQYDEYDAQPSPDGAVIVWMSWRTGLGEIWKSSATGGSPLQLTHLGTYSGTPRWSPDGKWIAFDNITGNGTQIFVIDSEGRNPHSITVGPYDNVVPSWSRDGKAIYFTSSRTGNWQVWKHSLDDGAESQLTKLGGFDPLESYDGRTIYFSKFDQAGIWSLPQSGGTESLVVADKPQVGYWGHWAVTKAGLYLLDTEVDPKPRIEFYNFATRRISTVLSFEKRPARLQPSLSATADGKTVYYTQGDWQSVIKMMDIPH
jgi:Tol biopolymer transport system component/DNA-binding winged helix-turn-helix (wHTH) protein